MKMREESRLKKENRMRLKEWIDQNVSELAKQLRSGKGARVTLPERGTELVEKLCLQLASIFKAKGYRTSYDTNPGHGRYETESDWGPSGYTYVPNYDKPPYFEIR